MKRLLVYLTVLIGLNCSNILAQSNARGQVLESLSMPSKILSHDLKFSVYLPADYNSSNRLYPVLYLLHGYSDNETAWVQFGEVNAIADRMIANNETTPMIIIMPDAGLSWYINSFDGKLKYEDAFFNEFIPYIEKTYRIRAKKEFRAIGGLSMGGYGSLLYAFKHSEMFTACIPFSAAIRNDTLMRKRLRLGESNSNVCYGYLKGDSLPETWVANDVLGLAKISPVEKLKSVDYYIDCGDKDFLCFGNTLLHFALNERKIPHEFRIRSGEHNWTYWRQSIDDGLRFLAPRFRR